MKKIAYLINALSLAITIFLISGIDGEAPSHFDPYGQVDRFGSKLELLILPTLTFLIIILIFVASEKENSVFRKQDQKIIEVFSILISLVFLIIQGVYVYAVNANVNRTGFVWPSIYQYISYIWGILSIVIGLCIPKTKKEKSLVSKLKWTKYNDRTSEMSNLFFSKAFIIAGILDVFAGLILKNVDILIAIVVLTLLQIIACLIYSYKIYKEEKSLIK